MKDEALVSDYIGESRNLSALDDQDLEIREQVVRKIAKFHQLNPPIKRDIKDFYVLVFFQYWTQVGEWFDLEVKDGFLRSAAKRLNCDNLLKENLLLQEVEFVKNQTFAIQDKNLVFSHNDLTHGNLLFQERHKKVWFIDFDYSCYFYRGKSRKYAT